MQIYKPGDIIFIRNVKFKDGGIDTRINGHPFVLLEDVIDVGQKVKCLKITSQIRSNQIKLGKHFLRKQSYVDLNKVYYLNINSYSFPYESLDIKSNAWLKKYIDKSED